MSASKRQQRQANDGADPMRLVIDTDAHAAMHRHCSASARTEVCGILVGFTGEDQRGRWTRVVSVIEGRHAREDQMSVTFTHETWDEVHARLAERNDKARVIGWYHTHPDFGIFFSAPDIFVHRSLFGLEGQVGVVIDPVREECGVFASTSRGLQVLSRFEVARQNKSGHIVRCAYQSDPLRDLAHEARAAAEPGETAFARSTLDSIEASIARVERRLDLQYRLLLVSVSVLVLLALVAGLYLGRRSQSNVLEIPKEIITRERSPIIIQVVEDTKRTPAPASKDDPGAVTPPKGEQPNPERSNSTEGKP